MDIQGLYVDYLASNGAKVINLWFREIISISISYLFISFFLDLYVIFL